MAFVTLFRKIVGDPITKEWTDRIKDNLDDLDQRINQNETTGGSVFILNSAIHLANFDSSNPGVFYYKATQDFSVSDFRAQIFNKGSISSGILTLDLEKSADTNESNFNSILNTAISFNFASDASYLEKTGLINSSISTIESGEILRVRVTSIPFGFKDKVLVSIGGE